MKPWVWVVLAASVAMNVGGAGAFFYTQAKLAATRGEAGYFIRQLQLDDAQADRLMQLRRAVAADQVILRNVQRADGVRAIDAFRSAQDAEDIRATQKAISDKAFEFRLRTADKLLDFRRSLTAEQRATLDSRLAEPTYLGRLAGLFESDPPTR